MGVERDEVGRSVLWLRVGFEGFVYLGFFLGKLRNLDVGEFRIFFFIRKEVLGLGLG